MNLLRNDIRRKIFEFSKNAVMVFWRIWPTEIICVSYFGINFFDMNNAFCRSFTYAAFCARGYGEAHPKDGLLSTGMLGSRSHKKEFL